MGRLNLDIPKTVAEFEALINKVMPKKNFYKLLLRGKGLEFESYRSFGQDEDASLIDWKASIRGGTLLARQYIEERNMKVMFVIDIGENMIFGSQEKLKCEYCAELVSAFSHTLINSGDKVGLILFNNHITKIDFPESGKNQFDIIVNELSDTSNYKGVSNIENVMHEILEILDPSFSLIVFVSDFLKVGSSSEIFFERIGSLFETMAIVVKDPLDKTLPDIDKEIFIEDPNTGDKLLVNPAIAKRMYEFNAEKQTQVVRNIFEKSNIDYVELITSEDFSYNLASFLKRRTDKR